jgi:hypothetical protein
MSARRGSAWLLAGLAALAWSGPAAAQSMQRSGGSFGGGASGGAGGGASGGASGLSSSNFGGGGASGSGSSLNSMFSLSNANFSGNTGTISGNTGNISGRGGSISGRGGSNTVGATSFLGPSMASPLALGAASSNGRTPQFGQALFNLTPPTVNTNTRNTVTPTTTNRNQAYAGTVGIHRNIGYVTEPAFPLVGVAMTPQRTVELQAILGAADNLPSRQGIQVGSDAGVIVLRGNVADEQERRLAEAVIRMTPGVQVRNELVPQR